MENPRVVRTDQSGLRGRISSLLDLVYPPRCAVCDVVLQGARSLCDRCDADLPRMRMPFCGKCGEPFEGRIEGPFACPNCRDLSFSFEFARPAMIWDERTLDLIHQLKYQRAIHLADELGRLAVESFSDERFQEALEAKWPLVPVPLHRSRFQRRTFNQAAEIARVMARTAGLPVLAGLRRTRPTDTQTLLGRRQRLKNLEGAFAVTPAGLRYLGESAGRVILVDDVLTTGSTVEACASTLRRAGFQSVLVITVMRG